MIDEKTIALRAQQLVKRLGIPFDRALGMVREKVVAATNSQPRINKQRKSKAPRCTSSNILDGMALSQSNFRTANDLVNEARKYGGIRSVVSGGAFELGRRR
jgi:hypothetical protein